VEVCTEFELITVQNEAALGDGLLEIGEGLEAQMTRNMRRGSPPRLMAPSCVPASGNPIRLHQPETVPTQSHATDSFSQSKPSFSNYALACSPTCWTIETSPGIGQRYEIASLKQPRDGDAGD